MQKLFIKIEEFLESGVKKLKVGCKLMNKMRSTMTIIAKKLDEYKPEGRSKQILVSLNVLILFIT